MRYLGYTLLGFTIYSFAQAFLNWFHSKQHKGYRSRVNWTYQNKEICLKTARINFEIGAIMCVLSILFLIIGK